MPKKKKGLSTQPASKPVTHSSTPLPVVKTTPSPVPSVLSTTTNSNKPGFELIRYDKRVKWLLGICLGLFIMLTLAKINYSSIGMWNTVLPDGSDAKRGVISGTPKAIRMDEWSVMVPFTLSQANNDYPTENTAIGGEKASLVLYLPVKNFVQLFRPDLWGFFISIDYGMSWRWNFILIFGYLVTAMLFLVLTRNNFWLSVLGSLWYCLSSGFAWWSFSSLSGLFIGGLVLISSIYLFFSTRTKSLLIAGLVFTWSMACFTLALYPPYQVPYGYLLVILLAGFTANYFDKRVLFNKLGAKIGILCGAFVLIGLALFLYYTEAKSTVDVMSNTVYPGKRSEVGGTGFIANWFSEYYSGWLLSDQKFPRNWLNICELSHFITFTPIICIGVAIHFIKSKKIDYLVLSVLVLVLVLLVWIEIGFPAFLAKITLLSVSPTRRTQIPFGMANVVLAILYLNYTKDKKINLPFAGKAVLVVATIAFMLYAAWLNLVDSEGFYKAHQLFIPTAFFFSLNLLFLPVWQLARKELIAVSCLVLFCLPNLRINPVNKGTAPITEDPLYKTIREIHLSDPKPRWIVIGNQYLTYMVTATGVNQLSGVKYLPDFKTMRVLGSTPKQDSAYNRYAHSVYSSYIDGRDSVVIVNTFEDGYAVALDPCSPKLAKLNAKYFLFEKTPQPVEIRCMSLVTKVGTLEIYKRNDL